MVQVEDGFATKAERRLASRLNSLLEAAERDKYGDSDAQTGDHDLVSPGSAIGSGLSVGTQVSNLNASLSSKLLYALSFL